MGVRSKIARPRKPSGPKRPTPKPGRRALVTDIQDGEYQTVRGKTFLYAGARYYVPFWREAELGTICWSDQHKLVIVVTKEDFGGCGKDALKPIIRPVEQWLHQHCTVIEPQQ
jgi:hypothetical protein